MVDRRKQADLWRQFAWNGIQFRAPQQWEIGQIGTRHLILEDAAGPVMEIKWGPVKGNFSHKAHLKRMAALQSRRDKSRVAEWFLPPHWTKALTGFETSGFVWQTDESDGRGAILFCRACHQAILIQFIGENTAKQEKVLLKVLKSFRDHRQDGRLRWSIFDIKADLPEALKLIRYRFETGKYELVFYDGAKHIHLQRWAPAAALLGGRSLVWFCSTIPEFAASPPPLSKDEDSNVIEWSVSPAGIWHRMMRRLNVKPSYFWFRLWHLEDKNRILSVRAESKKPFEFERLNRICADYESL